MENKKIFYLASMAFSIWVMVMFSSSISTVIWRDSYLKLPRPDLIKIWQEGYSTKGSGRGIGLSNYQNIIRKYPNVTQETKIEGDNFLQTLILLGNK